MRNSQGRASALCAPSGATENGSAYPQQTLPDANGWLPIETVPRDGREILCIDAGGIIRVCVPKAYMLDTFEYFRSDKWAPGHTWSLLATHWQPLPKPPEAK